MNIKRSVSTALVLLCMAVSSAFAQQQQTTPNLHLGIPYDGQLNWGPVMAGDLQTLDYVLAGAQSAPWSVLTTTPFKISNYNNSTVLFNLGLDGSLSLAGALTLPGDPTQANQAATKGYVDAHVSPVVFPKTTYLFKGDNNNGAVIATPGTDYVIPSALSAVSTAASNAQSTASSAAGAASNAQSTADSASSAAANAQTTANAAVPKTQVGVANGVASLGSDGKVPASQLPAGTGGTGGGIGGSGTTAYLLQWTSSTAAGDSFIDFGVSHADSYTSSKGWYVPSLHTYDMSGLGGAALWTEGNASTPTPGQDIVYASAATHAVMMANNGGPEQFVAGTTSYLTLTDGASLTWAGNSVRLPNATVTLNHATATRALNMTGLVSGSSGVLIINQDSTGGAQVTGGSGCTWKQPGGGGANFNLTTTPNAKDILTFSYDGTDCNVIVIKNLS